MLSNGNSVNAIFENGIIIVRDATLRSDCQCKHINFHSFYFFFFFISLIGRESKALILNHSIELRFVCVCVRRIRSFLFPFVFMGILFAYVCIVLTTLLIYFILCTMYNNRIHSVCHTMYVSVFASHNLKSHTICKFRSIDVNEHRI